MNTLNYWENRYKNNGNSGAGSYGRLAEFKAEIINKFIADKNINSVIEFGCGDGNQLSLFKVNKYTGYDISETTIRKLKSRFDDKTFKHISGYSPDLKSDLVLSLDVLFHLLEDTVFDDYMKKLFDTSGKYVIIYSCNRNDISNTPHIKFRVFLSWIIQNRPEWKLKNIIENKYPYDRNNPNNTSWSDFYFFERIN
ncbi:MAG TPA: methyltransferase domain-containing protein [Bacilli bacterium]|nr:methyltransferase domain-containing protein [Bacilli bacterium]